MRGIADKHYEFLEKNKIFIKVTCKDDSYHVLLKNDEVDLSFNDKDVSQELFNHIGPQLAGKIYVGHGIKYNDLRLFSYIITNMPTPNNLIKYCPKKDYKIGNNYVYLDLMDFTPNMYIQNSAFGYDITDDYSCLRNLYKIHKTNIMIKLQFMESDDMPFNYVLSRGINQLTEKALSNGNATPPIEDGYINLDDLDDELHNYIKRNIPKSIYGLLTTLKISEIRELKEKNVSKDPSKNMFITEMFDNIIIWGLGGLHSVHNKYKTFNNNPLSRLYHDDGSSFYPNLMVLLGCISRYADKYKFIGYLKDRIKEKKIDSKSIITHSLKIKINAMFGVSKKKGGLLYDPLMLYRTTILGQFIMASYANELHKIGCTILQTNTDGIYVVVPNDKQKEYREKQKEIARITGIDFDSDEVNKMWQPNVNGYVAQYTNGEIEAKNSNFAGDWENKKNELIDKKTYPIVQRAIKEYLVEGKSIEETIYGSKDLSEFILTVWNQKFRDMYHGFKHRAKVPFNDIGKYKNEYNVVISQKYNVDKIEIDYFKVNRKIEKNVTRCVPTLDKTGQLFCTDPNKKEIKKIANQSTNVHLLEKDLSEYNLGELNIDYEFLIKMTKRRLKEWI